MKSRLPTHEWASSTPSLEILALADQLCILRVQLRKQAQSAEHDAAIGAVAQAEVAAKSGNGSAMLEALASAGKWALEIAEKIGVTLAAFAIRKALGLP